MVTRTSFDPSTEQTFGTGSTFEIILNYTFTILVFGIFIAALLVPIFWILSNLKDNWHDLTTKQRVKTLLTYAVVVAGLALITWRSAMPSNF